MATNEKRNNTLLNLIKIYLYLIKGRRKFYSQHYFITDLNFYYIVESFLSSLYF